MNLKISWPVSEKSRLAQYITWLDKRIAIESGRPCLSDKDAANAAGCMSAYCSYNDLCKEWRRKEAKLMDILEKRGYNVKSPLKLIDAWLTACSTRCTADTLRKLDAIAVKAIGPYWRCQTITVDGTVIFEKLDENSKAIAGQGIQCAYIPDMQSYDGEMIDNGWLRVSLERCKSAFPATRYTGKDSIAQYYIEFGNFLSDKESLYVLSVTIDKYNKEQSLLDKWQDKLCEEMKRESNENGSEEDK